MNAIELLEQDHRRMEKILAELEGTTERAVKTRQALFATLRDELQLHEQVEEEILYPALRERSETKDIVLEGIEEHHVVDLILGELAGVDVADDVWTAKFAVMKESLEHHIEEEEGEMFPKAQSLLSTEALEAPGVRIEERKQAR